MPTLLRAHSCYSFLRGLPTPKALAEAAAQAGYTAVLLADHHGLTGALEFHDACQDLGLQPLLGLELHLEPGHERTLPPTLCLVALDGTGWSNLCQLSSLAQTRPDRDLEHGVSPESVWAHAAGLLCLVDAAAAGTISAAEWLAPARRAFGDRLYLTLDRQDPAAAAASAEGRAQAQRHGVAIVGGQRVYYLEPEHDDLQRTLAAIRVNRPRETLAPQLLAPPNAFLPSAAELWDRFADWDGLTDADEIAARCSLEIEKGRQLFPALDLPDGSSAEAVLQREATAGALRRYGSDGVVPTHVQSRLDHELAIITTKGFAPIFLVMQEVIAFARRVGVPSASRGSASSSLVAHCLDITTPDPLALNLYFERFLNPARATPPDIDTDLCSRRR
ncbi:MAG: PHP domain-containing protein, partial [Anaerolineales bacterium]|nr:PHP domain-containing protein [Anaerolineales bacterium]